MELSGSEGDDPWHVGGGGHHGAPPLPSPTDTPPDADPSPLTDDHIPTAPPGVVAEHSPTDLTGGATLSALSDRSGSTIDGMGFTALEDSLAEYGQTIPMRGPQNNTASRQSSSATSARRKKTLQLSAEGLASRGLALGGIGSAAGVPSFVAMVDSQSATATSSGRSAEGHRTLSPPPTTSGGAGGGARAPSAVASSIRQPRTPSPSLSAASSHTAGPSSTTGAGEGMPVRPVRSALRTTPIDEPLAVTFSLEGGASSTGEGGGDPIAPAQPRRPVAATLAIEVPASMGSEAGSEGRGSGGSGGGPRRSGPLGASGTTLGATLTAGSAATSTTLPRPPSPAGVEGGDAGEEVYTLIPASHVATNDVVRRAVLNEVKHTQFITVESESGSMASEVSHVHQRPLLAAAPPNSMQTSQTQPQPHTQQRSAAAGSGRAWRSEAYQRQASGRVGTGVPARADSDPLPTQRRGSSPAPSATGVQRAATASARDQHLRTLSPAPEDPPPPLQFNTASARTRPRANTVGAVVGVGGGDAHARAQPKSSGAIAAAAVGYDADASQQLRANTVGWTAPAHASNVRFSRSFPPSEAQRVGGAGGPLPTSTEQQRRGHFRHHRPEDTESDDPSAAIDRLFGAGSTSQRRSPRSADSSAPALQQQRSSTYHGGGRPLAVSVTASSGTAGGRSQRSTAAGHAGDNTYARAVLECPEVQRVETDVSFLTGGGGGGGDIRSATASSGVTLASGADTSQRGILKPGSSPPRAARRVRTQYDALQLDPIVSREGLAAHRRTRSADAAVAARLRPTSPIVEIRTHSDADRVALREGAYTSRCALGRSRSAGGGDASRRGRRRPHGRGYLDMSDGSSDARGVSFEAASHVSRRSGPPAHHADFEHLLRPRSPPSFLSVGVSGGPKQQPATGWSPPHLRQSRSQPQRRGTNEQQQQLQLSRPHASSGFLSTTDMTAPDDNTDLAYSPYTEGEMLVPPSVHHEDAHAMASSAAPMRVPTPVPFRSRGKSSAAGSSALEQSAAASMRSRSGRSSASHESAAQPERRVRRVQTAATHSRAASPITPEGVQLRKAASSPGVPRVRQPARGFAIDDVPTAVSASASSAEHSTAVGPLSQQRVAHDESVYSILRAPSPTRENSRYTAAEAVVLGGHGAGDDDAGHIHDQADDDDDGLLGTQGGGFPSDTYVDSDGHADADVGVEYDLGVQDSMEGVRNEIVTRMPSSGVERKASWGTRRRSTTTTMTTRTSFIGDVAGDAGGDGNEDSHQYLTGAGDGHAAGTTTGSWHPTLSLTESSLSAAPPREGTPDDGDSGNDNAAAPLRSGISSSAQPVKGVLKTSSGVGAAGASMGNETASRIPPSVGQRRQGLRRRHTHNVDLPVFDDEVRMANESAARGLGGRRRTYGGGVSMHADNNVEDGGDISRMSTAPSTATSHRVDVVGNTGAVGSTEGRWWGQQQHQQQQRGRCGVGIDASDKTLVTSEKTAPVGPVDERLADDDDDDAAYGHGGDSFDEAISAADVAAPPGSPAPPSMLGRSSRQYQYPSSMMSSHPGEHTLGGGASGYRSVYGGSSRLVYDGPPGSPFSDVMQQPSHGRAGFPSQGTDSGGRGGGGSSHISFQVETVYPLGVRASHSRKDDRSRWYSSRAHGDDGGGGVSSPDMRAPFGEYSGAYRPGRASPPPPAPGPAAAAPPTPGSPLHSSVVYHVQRAVHAGDGGGVVHNAKRISPERQRVQRQRASPACRDEYEGDAHLLLPQDRRRVAFGTHERQPASPPLSPLAAAPTPSTNPNTGGSAGATTTTAAGAPPPPPLRMHDRVVVLARDAVEATALSDGWWDPRIAGSCGRPGVVLSVRRNMLQVHTDDGEVWWYAAGSVVAAEAHGGNTDAPAGSRRESAVGVAGRGSSSLSAYVRVSSSQLSGKAVDAPAAAGADAPATASRTPSFPARASVTGEAVAASASRSGILSATSSPRALTSLAQHVVHGTLRPASNAESRRCPACHAEVHPDGDVLNDFCVGCGTALGGRWY